MVFHLKDVNLRKPETYGVYMEQKDRFPSYDTGYYFENAPYEHQLISNNDIKPVVENTKENSPPSSSSAHAVSYERHQTPKGVTSSVIHHGGRGSKLNSEQLITSGSFSYQGRTFKYGK